MTAIELLQNWSTREKLLLLLGVVSLLLSLASWALGLRQQALWRRRLVASLAPINAELQALRKSIDARPRAHGPERSVEERPARPARSSADAVSPAPDTAHAPPDPRPVSPVAPANSGVAEAATPTAGGGETEAERWLDSLRSEPHGAVAVALGTLYLQSRHLSKHIREPEASAQLRKATEQLVPQRIQRLAALERDAHPSHLQEWVEVDLVPTLDLLSRYLGIAISELRQGNPGADLVRESIEDLMYRRLRDACIAEGWFEILPIIPYSTEFDPRIHQAVGNRAEPGMSNRILEVRKTGLRDLRTGAMSAVAHVVVGR